jgi:hypothetical protein
MLYSYEDVENYMRSNVVDGYEGIMIYRNSPYKSTRSADLLKYKYFIDAEVKILDIISASGNETGLGLLIVDYAGYALTLRPNLSSFDRQNIYENKTIYIGKIVKIKYHGVSHDGIPINPTMISFV